MHISLHVCLVTSYTEGLHPTQFVHSTLNIIYFIEYIYIYIYIYTLTPTHTYI